MSAEPIVRVVPPGRKDSGQLMLYPDYALLAEAVRAIPAGEFRDRKTFRQQLAAAAGAEVTCPVTTAKVMRTIASEAVTQLNGGTDRNAVIPFWRAVDPNSSEAKSLPDGPDLIRSLRQSEL